jgi:hypothetical protein
MTIYYAPPLSPPWFTRFSGSLSSLANAGHQRAIGGGRVVDLEVLELGRRVVASTNLDLLALGVLGDARVRLDRLLVGVAAERGGRWLPDHNRFWIGVSTRRHLY